MALGGLGRKTECGILGSTTTKLHTNVLFAGLEQRRSLAETVRLQRDEMANEILTSGAIKEWRPCSWLVVESRYSEIVWLDKGGTAPGLFEGIKRESEQVRLGRSDSWRSNSDGSVELRRERIAKLIASHDRSTAEQLLDVVFSTLANFTEHQAPADDQTLLVLKIN